MNIYVTDKLRELMRSFDGQVNWSQLAAEAFEDAIAEVERIDKIKNPTKRRLAISRMDKSNQLKSYASQLAIEWAANVAEDIELRRLASHVSTGQVIEGIDDLANVICDKGAGMWKYTVITKHVPPEYESVFVNAFVKAALATLKAADEAE